MSTKINKVCVVGLGYIGLPTAALLASSGYQVIGVDVNELVVNYLNDGKVSIAEPDLDEIVRSTVAKGSLRASTTPEEADIFIICVPTPIEHHATLPSPNMEFVMSATSMIAPFIKSGNGVILESTSPVGSTELVGRLLSDRGIDLSTIDLAYCPERVLPGQIMRELVENDRIVGGTTHEATQRMSAFYRTFVSKGQVIETDARTAEMSKLVENSFRDVNIAFANELSVICEKAGINVKELISLANRHPRVNILNPGPGVGGHCIAVDPWFIVSMDPKNSRIIRTAREINDHKSEWTLDQIVQVADKFEANNLRRPTIAVLGLTFKPNTDDLRNSPALEIARTIVTSGYSVIAVDPHLSSHDSLKIVTLKEALIQADIIAILVAHQQFSNLEVGSKPILDFCGIRDYQLSK